MKELKEGLDYQSKYLSLKNLPSSENLFDAVGYLLFASYLSALALVIKDLVDLNIVRSKLGITKRELGNHGALYFSSYRGRKKELSDGTIISSGSIVGEIDLIKRIRTKRFSSLGYLDASRELLKDFLKAMVKLSRDINVGNFPEDVVAISGTSHLVGERIAIKMGFDVQEPPLIRKIMASGYGLGYALEMGNEKNVVRMFRKKWRRTHSAWMSTQKIAENLPLFEKLLKEIE
ncbi:MAG: hypothetical protein A2804_01435 [Candidatus Pacebacteria bacterium RIFCSPHIGHO2_01_FULL_46_10]|nr:MAG: hypothetical protein A2804_01435 [Candidatus Pacebacteria bacterium RIFCSPHIGHO2_01_FULL_46_10]